MHTFQASKIRNRWVIVDTVANVHYHPPKGTKNAQKWARDKAAELNTGK